MSFHSPALMKSEKRYDTPNRDEVNGEIREKPFQTRSEMDHIYDFKRLSLSLT